MGSKYGTRPEDIFHSLQLQINAQQKQIDRLTNQKSLSVGILDVAQLPRSVPGQIVIDDDGTFGYINKAGVFVALLGNRNFHNSGNVNQATTSTQTIVLTPRANYLLVATLSGPNQDISQLYSIHSPFTGNLNIGKTSLSSKSYNLGAIAVETQNNGADLAVNASSNFTIVIKFTAASTGSGGGNAIWSYTLVALNNP